jgi:hypothetical protein
MSHAQPLFSAAPMFVELSGAGLRHVLELDSATERVFVVGSSRQADVPIEAAGVASIEFHLERVGDEVWLTPAYRGRGLRINGTVTRDRVQVATGLHLRLGRYDLAVKLLSDREGDGDGDGDRDEPTARSSSAPRPLPNDYSLRLPTDTKKTSVALAPSTSEVADTARIPAKVASMFALPVQQTERIAPVVAIVQETERVASTGAQRVAAQPLPEALLQTVRMEPVRCPPRSLIATTHPGTPPASLSSLVTQDTTAFDVEALDAVADIVKTGGGASACVDAAPSPPKQIGRGPTRARVLSTMLEQLGIATRQRPIVVAGGALGAALVLALALVGATRITGSAAQRPPQRPATSTVALPTAAPSTVVATVVPAPSVLVAPVPPTATGRAAIRVDSPLVVATRHLSAGRLAEAAEQYRALGSASDGAVYAKVAALLSRRLSPACASTPATHGDACPEIVK